MRISTLIKSNSPHSIHERYKTFSVKPFSRFDFQLFLQLKAFCCNKMIWFIEYLWFAWNIRVQHIYIHTHTHACSYIKSAYEHALASALIHCSRTFMVNAAANEPAPQRCNNTRAAPLMQTAFGYLLRILFSCCLLSVVVVDVAVAVAMALAISYQTNNNIDRYCCQFCLYISMYVSMDVCM